MTTSTYVASGLTCEHCVHAVKTELGDLPSVSGVEVDLVPEGESTITVHSEQKLDESDVRAALEEAGDYPLVRATSV